MTDQVVAGISIEDAIPVIWRELVSLIRWRCGPEIDAEDVAQDAILGLLIRQQTRVYVFNHPAALRRYLYKVAVNNVADSEPMREFRRWLEMQAFDVDAFIDPDTEEGAEQPGTVNRSLSMLLGFPDLNTAQIIDLVKGNFSERQWEILQRHYMQNQTAGEIARALEMTEVNVRVTLHRSRKKIQLMRQPHDEPRRRGGAPEQTATALAPDRAVAAVEAALAAR